MILKTASIRKLFYLKLKTRSFDCAPFVPLRFATPGLPPVLH